MTSWPRCAAFILVLWITGWIPACSNHQTDNKRDNLRPYVKVTGGPREGTRGSYRATVYWAGWDDDGVIHHYEYAVDPPSEFSDDEIANPESSPGVTTSLVPARFSGQPDTVRVQKILGEKILSFDYIQTFRSDHIFNLEATRPDSLYIDGKKGPWVTSSGVHRLYVRSVDSEGLASLPDQLGFTAWTYTPTSWLTYPDTGRGLLHIGQKVILEWSGRDPDPPSRAREKPVGYLYKLIDLRALEPPMSVIYVTNPQAVAFERAHEVPWTYVDAETTSMTLHVDPGEYLFALRAVDAAGGVEPFLQWGRGVEGGNALLFTVALGAGRPDLVMADSFLGEFAFRGTGTVYNREVPVGTRIRFSWTATAEEYGGRIESYSYGMDIADLENEGPGSGWTPWGLTTTSEPFTFREPGIHVFYVRVKDSSERVTIGSVAMQFFDMPFDQEVLYVDDYLDKRFPLDRDHDAFWRDLFHNSGRFTSFDLRPENLWFETGGEGDGGFLNPEPPRLSELGRYRLVVWNVHGAGFCGRTGLFTAAGLNPWLGSYLSAGGKLWISGKMTLAPTRVFEGSIDCPILPVANTAYPQTFEPGNFAFDFLKLPTTVDNGKGFDWYNSLVRVEAWNRENPIFETMFVDSIKVGELRWENDALGHCDAIVQPILTGDIPDYRGKVDSLYVYRAAGQERRPGDDRYISALEKRLCATRWSDLDPARAQGRVMWFGFPLYYMDDLTVQDTFNKAIDWFREEERPREEDSSPG